MPAGRRSARRQAVFILYQQDLLGLTAGAALLRSGEIEIDSYTRGLVLGVARNQKTIDKLLARHLADWSVARLGILERAILRVAVYELLEETGVPKAVVMNEAVALAKRFCSAEAGSLVNGVLGSLVTREEPEESEVSAPAKDDS
ncbi:MAG: transcription antitermination factor NusB [Thermoleophilia bacterium]|nr:transcription antitermination factor NusB [Thermoleophilia bacterium]